MYSTVYQSPIGVLTMASDGQNLVGLWIEGQKYHGAVEKMTEQSDILVFKKTKSWFDSYFAGQKPEVSELQLAPIGGKFRQCVWNILRSTPHGRVITYGQIARKTVASTGRSMSSQAVGGAVGHNPISIIIPCHRVVGSNGSLTGYAGGIATKVKLLELEGVDMTSLFVPKTGTALVNCTRK
ncbi:MAG: methylated-DNA--[protein]-cysteine S-methyltransferase [Candidatus Ancillula trichonymphae]|jgi:methylated-DNA-[protein]-cysteine S-methyltransferase|nr:methylated-DNA--[protein]-cysteine S-methyltransferase [Candidatus Ancillula trichonymphae]